MRKTHKRKKHTAGIMSIFLLTFSLVLVVGVGAILIFKIISENREATDIQPGSVETMAGTFQEKIPEENKDFADSEESSDPGEYAEILADATYMRQNNIYALQGSTEGEVNLAFGGDILFDPGYSVMAKLLTRPGGIRDSISEDMLREMNGADIMMLNNEFPYSNAGTPLPEKQYTFRAKPESASLLKDMGVDIVSLANNHAYDFGERALLDSLETLEQVGVPYVGAGRNLDEAAAPVYFIVNDIKIGIVSATQIERLDNPDTRGATETTPGVFRCWNPDKLLEVIQKTKENCDFLVVYIHWGSENTDVLDWAQMDQAPKIVEAGADLVIGDHPHCLQEIQYIDGVPVIYSLGNFWFNSKQVDTCLVKVAVGKEGLKSFQFLPALQKDSKTVLLYDAEKERVLSYMRSLSEGVNIDENGLVTQK